MVTLTGVNYQQITKLVKAGVLPAIKPGGFGRAYFRKEDVEKVFQIKL